MVNQNLSDRPLYRGNAPKKFYTIKNGRVESRDINPFNDLKNIKRRSLSQNANKNAKIYSISRREVLPTIQNTPRANVKLWHYEKDNYQKPRRYSAPNVKEEEPIRKYETPRQVTPPPRELTPLPRQITPPPRQITPPPRQLTPKKVQEYNKVETKAQRQAPSPILILPPIVPPPPISSIRTLESINKSMKWYRF